MIVRRHRLLEVFSLAALAAPLTAGAAKPAPQVPADPAIAYHQHEAAANGSVNNVWVMNYDGKRKTRLLTADSSTSGWRRPSLDPTGAAIAARRDGNGFNGPVDIWVWDIQKDPGDGSVTPTAVNRRLLDRDASCQEDPTQAICVLGYMDSAWAPDGMHLAVALRPAGLGAGSGMLRVWTWTDVARTVGSYETLYTPPDEAKISSPTWSPDGTQVAFVRFNGGNGGPSVCVVDWPGPPGGWNTCTPVPADPDSSCHDVNAYWISWSPVSATPYFARGLELGSRSGADAIFFQDDAGCSPPIDGSPFYHSGLSWTPDGRALDFTSAVDDGRRGATTYRLHQLCVDGADPVNGPNRRLLLYKGSVPAFDLDRRRVDPGGTPNICDDPSFPEG